LRAELAQATTASWKGHDAELDRLRREQTEVQRSLYRQTLRLEEHDDPDHPIVALATRRIEELAAHQESIDEAITALRVKRPEGARPDEIVAMLDAIPDMREALNEADEDELIELFDAFDVCATYTKSTRRLELAASVTPELVASQGRSQEGVQNPPPLFHESPANAGFSSFWWRRQRGSKWPMGQRLGQHELRERSIRPLCAVLGSIYFRAPIDSLQAARDARRLAPKTTPRRGRRCPLLTVRGGVVISRWFPLEGTIIAAED
jgi:hypothetical protein